MTEPRPKPRDIFEQIKMDEGLRLTTYRDSVGIATIGYGHNLEAHEQAYITTCTMEQAEQWLKEDLLAVQLELEAHLPWALKLDVVRFGVLQNMCFNLGIIRLLGFKHVLGSMEVAAWTAAANEMKSSLWARQVGARADRLERQVVTGEWQ